MSINTVVARNEWKDFLATFSNGNQGRDVNIEVVATDSPYDGKTKAGKLMAVDYDPPGHGDNIILTTGVDAVDYSHAIHGPVEIWQAQHDDGSILALEIVDDQGAKTVLSLG